MLKIYACCITSNQRITLVKVDSREVLTIFWVGVGRPQLRCFTWIHWLVVCHRRGLKIYFSLPIPRKILKIVVLETVG